MSLFQTLIPSRQRAAGSNGSAALNHTVKPAYEIKENADSYDLTVYLPGVAKDAVEITDEDGRIRLTARRAWQQPESWTALYRESAGAPFELVLGHDNVIDGDKIAAELRDGVLRVALPKSEAVKPRKIAVN